MRAGLVGHQARLIEHRRHAARVAEGLVDALQARVDEVELVRHRVRVGEHEDDRARRDAEPGVAAGDEHRHHGHDDHGDGRRGDATGKRGPHALRIARHHLAIRRVEQPPLVVLAPVGLHGQDVRDRIRQFAGQLVLGAGGLFSVSVQASVLCFGAPREHRHEHRRIGRHHRKQDEAGEGDGAKDRQKREVHGLQKLGVTGHEFRGLADERATEAVGMERQRLVAQTIEGHGGQIVVHGDLQLPQRVVLKLAAGLSRQIDADERDDEAHHVGVAVGEKAAEPDRRGDERHEQAQVIARRQPVVVQTTHRKRLLLRHRSSLLFLRLPEGGLRGTAQSLKQSSLVSKALGLFTPSYLLPSIPSAELAW